MSRTKKPCCVCRKWFEPDPRLGKRQRACASEKCQRERHRRSCAAWRERDRPKAEERRLRDRIVGDDGEVDREALRDACGVKVAVGLEESLRLLVSGSRDAFQRKVLEITPQSIRLQPRHPRDATALVGPAP